ncbi:MAG: hypothetical protein IPH11_07395 [Ignavibacteriales bacterium]|nr:hypothetical protein [Ignavibacteriales bacterium]
MKNFSFLVFIFTISSIYAQQDSLSIFKSLPNDTTFVSDSSLTDSSSLVRLKPDSLIVLNLKCFSENSFFINNKDITFNDYRYAGDFLRIFPFTFIKDLVFIGLPN